MAGKGWSEGGQLYFDQGWAWGVLSNGQTVCIGTEENIRKKENPKNNPALENILRIERAMS